MSTDLQYLPHYTYDDYLHWEGRWEIIDGHPIAKSEYREPEHQRLAACLLTAFNLPLKKVKTCRLYPSVSYKVSKDTVLLPDLVIVSTEIVKPLFDFTSCLVAEVVSATTVLIDRHLKFDKYQQQEIRYYLMVDAEKEIFYLYQLIDGQYRIIEYDFNAPFPFLFDDCKVEVRLNEVWENL